MSYTGVADLAYRLLSTAVEETMDLEGVYALQNLLDKFDGDPGFNASAQFRQRAHDAVTAQFHKIKRRSSP